ncbi:MAG: hypothetical protein GY772_17355, partial [bacterium]|nr:hypothetical protein [bacterium]
VSRWAALLHFALSKDKHQICVTGAAERTRSRLLQRFLLPQQVRRAHEQHSSAYLLGTQIAYTLHGTVSLADLLLEVRARLSRIQVAPLSRYLREQLAASMATSCLTWGFRLYQLTERQRRHLDVTVKAAVLGTDYLGKRRQCTEIMQAVSTQGHRVFPTWATASLALRLWSALRTGNDDEEGASTFLGALRRWWTRHAARAPDLRTTGYMGYMTKLFERLAWRWSDVFQVEVDETTYDMGDQHLQHLLREHLRRRAKQDAARRRRDCRGLPEAALDHVAIQRYLHAQAKRAPYQAAVMQAVLEGGVLLGDRLERRSEQQELRKCRFCKTELETIDHVAWHCVPARLYTATAAGTPAPPVPSEETQRLLGLPTRETPSWEPLN